MYYTLQPSVIFSLPGNIIVRGSQNLKTLKCLNLGIIASFQTGAMNARIFINCTTCAMRNLLSLNRFDVFIQQTVQASMEEFLPILLP